MERALEMAESTTMDWILQAMTRVEIRKNGEGIEQGVEGYHPVEAYRRDELKPASLSSVNRGEVS